jgi:hypothetical protein
MAIVAADDVELWILIAALALNTALASSRHGYLTHHLDVGQAAQAENPI